MRWHLLASIVVANGSCLRDDLVRCADGRACPVGSSCIDNAAPEGPFCVSMTCGNNTIEPGIEDCEPGSAIVETCSSFGFYGGVLQCNPSTCRYDTGECAGRCGDNVIDSGLEECDADALIETGCTALSGQFAWGRPSCTPSCTFDTSTCTSTGFSSRFEGTKSIGRFCAFEDSGEVIAYVAQGPSVLRVTSAGVDALPGVASQPINDLACNATEIFLASYGLFRHDYVGSQWRSVPLTGIPADVQLHDLAEYGSAFGGVGYAGTILTGSGSTWTVENYDGNMTRIVATTFTSTGKATAVSQSGEYFVRSSTGGWTESFDSQLYNAKAWMWGNESTTLVALSTSRLLRRLVGWTLEQNIGGPISGRRADSLFVGHQDGFLRHFDGVQWRTALEASGVFDQLWTASDGVLWGAAGAELLRAEHLWFATAGGERARVLGSHVWVATTSQLLRDGVVQPSPSFVMQRIAAAGAVVFAIGTSSVSAAGRLDTSVGSPSWQTVTNTPAMNAIVAIDATHAVAVGANGSVLTYGPAGWNSPTASGTTQTLRGLARAPTGELIAVGDAGTILTSPDGTSWSTVNHGLVIDQALRAVWVAPDGTVHVVGDDGTIVRRTGTQWERMYSPVTVDLDLIAGDSASRVFAAGQVALLRYDGEVWTRMRTPIGGLVFTSLAIAIDHLYASTATQTFLLYRP